MELLPHFHTLSQSLAHIFEIWLFLALFDTEFSSISSGRPGNPEGLGTSHEAIIQVIYQM